MGGNTKQLPIEELEEAMLKVFGAMGHNDLHTTGAYYGSFARPQAMNPLGGKIGATLILDSHVGVTCQIWANPAPRSDEHGVDYIPRSSRPKVVLAAVVESEDGAEEKMSPKNLVERWPGIRSQVRRQGEALQIEDLIDQGWAEE